MGIFDELRRVYSEGKLALFVGAGVSVSCGLPDWKRLAEKVIEQTWPRSIQPYAHPMIRHAVGQKNPLDSMRIVRQRLKQQFNDMVRQALYDNGTVVSDLVMAIVTLQHVRRICCYNYDDVLEDALDRTQKEYYTVYQGDQIPFLSNALVIFHPHGYLPRLQRTQDTTSEFIVLSEDDYHQLYASPYSWSNLLQLGLLMNYSALFVGCSLTDPNMRRLLDIVKEMQPTHQHFALLKDPTYQPDKTGWDLMPFPTIKAFEEEDLHARGVLPIWFNEYADIAQMLRALSV
jgi:hypothetical protein